MDRRDFLKYMLATPLAATFDYEKLLWVPEEKTIFLPPAPQIITPDDIYLLCDMAYGESKVEKMFYANNKFFEMLSQKEVMTGNKLTIPLGGIPIKRKLF